MTFRYWDFFEPIPSNLRVYCISIEWWRYFQITLCLLPTYWLAVISNITSVKTIKFTCYGWYITINYINSRSIHIWRFSVFVESCLNAIFSNWTRIPNAIAVLGNISARNVRSSSYWTLTSSKCTSVSYLTSISWG